MNWTASLDDELNALLGETSAANAMLGGDTADALLGGSSIAKGAGKLTGSHPILSASQGGAKGGGAFGGGGGSMLDNWGAAQKGGGGWGKDAWSGGKDFGSKGMGKGMGKIDGKGKGASKINNGETVYHGQIKTYDAEKKRGFIVCDEVYNMCGKDVYIFGNVLEGSGAAPGDSLAFFLHWSPTSGQPQASSPIVRLKATEGYATKGTYKPDATGKGHGFLVSDLKEFFGRDVYVPKDIAAQMEPGCTVAFNVYLNKDGMPNVDNQGFEVCQAEWEPTPGDISVSRTDPSVVGLSSKGDGGKGKGKGKGMDKGMGKGMDDGWGKGMGAETPQPSREPTLLE